MRCVGTRSVSRSTTRIREVMNSTPPSKYSRSLQSHSSYQVHVDLHNTHTHTHTHTLHSSCNERDLNITTKTKKRSHRSDTEERPPLSGRTTNLSALLNSDVMTFGIGLVSEYSNCSRKYSCTERKCVSQNNGILQRTRFVPQSPRKTHTLVRNAHSEISIVMF